MSKFKKIFYLFLPLVIGGLVGLIIKNSIDYSSLIKPLLAPPKALFPIMWTIIYILMGIAFYIYKKNSNKDLEVDKIYYSQLIVNALWSIIFFTLKLRLLAIIWIIILLVLLIYLNVLYFKYEKKSFYLNILYIVWTIFATYLTIGIYFLN